MMRRAFSYIDDHGPARTDGLMKIGEVSKKSGVGIEAIRFYEKSGLLERPDRTYSGYRMYPAEVLDRIAFIKQAQTLGFSLDEINQLISLKRKDRKSTRLNSSHIPLSRMPSSA